MVVVVVGGKGGRPRKVACDGEVRGEGRERLSPPLLVDKAMVRVERSPMTPPPI